MDIKISDTNFLLEIGEEEFLRLLEQIIMLSFSSSSGDKKGKENVQHGFFTKNLSQINPSIFLVSSAAWQACIHLVATSISNRSLICSDVPNTNLAIYILFIYF